MSSKNKNTKPKKKAEVTIEDLSKPWIQQKTGFRVITAMSIVIMFLVAIQIIVGSGDWGRGLLWGLLFGGSIWLVFFGMNWFHTLFHPKTKQVDNSKDQK